MSRGRDRSHAVFAPKTEKKAPSAPQTNAVPQVVVDPIELTEAINQQTALALTELANFNYYKPKDVPSGWRVVENDYTDSKTPRRNLLCYRKEGPNGRKYEVMIDGRNNTKTLIIHGNADDRKRGLVGTDNTAVIKIIGKNGYNFIKVDDFVDRQKLIYQAMLAILNNARRSYEEALIKLPEDQQMKYQGKLHDLIKLIAAINECQENSLAAIRKSCDFSTHSNAMRHSASKEFNEPCNRARSILEKSLNDCAWHVAGYRKKHGGDPDPYHVIEEIKAKEGELIAERGRPLDIKLTTAGEDAPTMISAQMPLGEKTLPSTHRTGIDPKTKLSNHVRDFTGTINPKTRKVESRLVVDGHSAYCPIKQKDPSLRLYYGYLAAREKALQLAQDQLAKNPDLTKINLNLTTLGLLSPLVAGFIDKIARGSASEYKQLEDLRANLMMLMSDTDLALTVNGRRIPVEVNSTLMNFPVNANGPLLKGVNPLLQDQINARGFFEFRRNMQGQIEGLFKLKLAGDLSSVEQKFVDDLNEYFKKTPRDNNNEKYSERYAEAEKYSEKYGEAVKVVVGEANRLQQRKNYHHLLEMLMKYEKAKATGNAKDITAAEKAVAAAQEVVNEHNKVLDKAYLNINDAFEYQFQHDENGGKLRNINLVNDIHQYLRLNKDNLTSPVREKLIGMVHALQAERFYHERFECAADCVYDFQIQYLLANYSAGQLIEAFCKSAEDRTGALRFKLLAHMMFEEINKYPPNLHDPNDKEELLKYMKVAVELAASLENTKHNSQARGYQVKEIFTVNGYNIKAGKM